MSPYGPDPSRQQIDVPAGLADEPVAWAVSVGAAVFLALIARATRGRPALSAGFASFALTAALTAPFLGLLPRVVYGDYPTIDKQGSLLFYLEGVHRRMLADPATLPEQPAARLIGVHVGHLWVTEAFDVVLEPFAAMNAQALLWLGLGTWCAWGFFRTVGGDPRVALVLAVPFGLGLHTFRDLNWYTIEKAAIFALPLYATCWWRTVRDGGPWGLLAALVFAAASFLNLYLGLVIALVTAVATALLLAAQVREARRAGPGAIRRVLAARSTSALVGSYVATALVSAPLAIGQAMLLSSGPTLASPECFLWKRAALDTVTLWPPAWNRLEAWRALHPVGVVAGAWGLVRERQDRAVRGLFAVGLVALVLSLGPRLVAEVPNPVYLAAWHGLPFFWRIAKPEVFAFPAWLCWLAIGAVAASRRRPGDRAVLVAGLVTVLLWVPLVRLHPAYPGFTQYVPGKLAPGWEARLARQAECR